MLFYRSRFLLDEALTALLFQLMSLRNKTTNMFHKLVEVNSFICYNNDPIQVLIN